MSLKLNLLLVSVIFLSYDRPFIEPAIIAANKGIKLSKLNVNTQYIINFAKTFDVADVRITEGINFNIEAESYNVNKKTITRIGNYDRTKMSCNT